MERIIRQQLIIMLLFFANSAFTQDSLHLKSSSETLLHRVRNDGHLLGKTIIETYKLPFRWEKKQWLLTGGALAASVASTVLDRPIYLYYKEHNGKNLFLAKVAKVGDFMGQPENNYPFMITMWSLGVLTKNEWLRDTGILLFASVTTSGIVQTALKDLVGRARPATGEGPYSFKPFSGAAYHSFPSGHTMLALASAYVLAHQIDFMPLRIVVFAIPVITGWSRLHDGAHYFSDLALGSAIGIAFAEAVLNIYPKLKKEMRGNISLSPGYNGIRLTYSF